MGSGETMVANWPLWQWHAIYCFWLQVVYVKEHPVCCHHVALLKTVLNGVGNLPGDLPLSFD